MAETHNAEMKPLSKHDKEAFDRLEEAKRQYER